MKSIQGVVCCVVAVLITTSGGAAQDSQPASAPAVLDQMSTQMRKAPTTRPAPTTQPAKTSGSGTSVLDQMQQQMQGNPALAPSQSKQPIGKPRPEIRIGPDPKHLGHAPNMPAPTLKREGDFVINRRGRMKLTPGGNYALFVFDSDGATLGDPPMVLVPCELLELMEKQVQERGEQVIFRISGQILSYHNVNYLLATMVKLDVDRGNLGK